MSKLLISNSEENSEFQNNVKYKFSIKLKKNLEPLIGQMACEYWEKEFTRTIMNFLRASHINQVNFISF